MSYAITPNYTTTKKSGTGTGTAITPLGGATNISAVHVLGATFLSTGTRVCAGDGCTISGSGAGNDGTYLIVSVPDDETVIVRAALSTEGSGFNYALKTGQHILTITDEATTSWSAIATALAEPAYVQLTTHTDSLVVVHHSIANINVVISAISDTTWSSTHEIVYSRQPLSVATITPSGATPALYLNIGELASSDRRSYWKGSVWAGFLFAGSVGTLTVKAYGSLLRPNGTGTQLGRDSKYFGCIYVGQPTLQSGDSVSGLELHDVLMYVVSTGTAPTFYSSIAHAENIILSRNTSTAFLFGAGTVVLSDVGKSDSVASPLYNMIIADIDVRDLKSDAALSAWLTTLSGTSTDARKSYTFNPVIKGSRNEAIQGAKVYLWRIDASSPLGTQTAVSGSPFTTDANGQINSGSGVALEMQHGTGSPMTTTTYLYRLVVEATGYHQADVRIQLTSRFDGDVVLRSYEPAFEGEEATL